MVRRLMAILGMLATCQAHAMCSFGTSGETSLQGVFDSILPSGALSATSDCLAEGTDARWSEQGEAVATIVIELAGFAQSNTFGIYDSADPTQRATIFGGASAAGDTATVQISQSGGLYQVFNNGAWAANFTSSVFGFFLSTPQGNVFMSDSGLNTDGGADHMYAYRGNGTSFVGGALAGTTFATNMYLLAFEDLAFPNSDRDYQDFVAAAQFVVPVPLPGNGWVLAALILAFFARVAVQPARMAY